MEYHQLLKHYYHTKSAVGVIFVAVTKKLLFIEVRNKYCSLRAIGNHINSPCPSCHGCQCFKDYYGSFCTMERTL